MEAMADGSVHILAGSTEMGQGTNTIFAQIAAEALRLGLRADQDRAAGYGLCAEQRTYGGFAHGDDCGQAGGNGGDLVC